MKEVRWRLDANVLLRRVRGSREPKYRCGLAGAIHLHGQGAEATRESTYADFPALLKRSRKCLDETARARPRLRLAGDLRALDEVGDSLAALQRAHRGVLLKLATLRKEA